MPLTIRARPRTAALDQIDLDGSYRTNHVARSAVKPSHDDVTKEMDTRRPNCALYSLATDGIDLWNCLHYMRGSWKGMVEGADGHLVPLDGKVQVG